MPPNFRATCRAIACVSLYRITREGHAENMRKLAAQAEQVEGGEGPEHTA